MTNANYIPPLALGLTLGTLCLELGTLGLASGLLIPTCWYWQCKILTLGVKPNASTHREQFYVAVEYRLLKVGGPRPLIPVMKVTGFRGLEYSTLIFLNISAVHVTKIELFSPLITNHSALVFNSNASFPPEVLSIMICN